MRSRDTCNKKSRSKPRVPPFRSHRLLVYRPVPTHQIIDAPPNITKQYLVAAVEGPDATPEVELNKILSTRPAFIVKNKDLWYLTEGEPITRLLTRTLKSNYFLANVINGREIYRFKGVSGANRGSEANN